MPAKPDPAATASNMDGTYLSNRTAEVFARKNPDGTFDLSLTKDGEVVVASCPESKEPKEGHFTPAS